METKQPSFAAQDAAAEAQRFMTSVYGWMSFALVITGLVAIYVASSENLLALIFSSQWVFIGLIIFRTKEMIFCRPIHNFRNR